ncbi:YdcF family protein [Galactobacter sp.]|uniref:YdcF family protein n=1 Tax=Galactobacter sp. TaxID=2676125 RepID=UPI0025BB15DB|nr:YdcF family protein [Galactobacter sp.]
MLSLLLAAIWYALYRWAAARDARRPVLNGPDAVVVLGSGLINGKVPPLLAARLDLGRKAFAEHRDATTIMIPSGGQGPDEPRPEGEAMAEYLVEHGMNPADVVAETRSRTTEENLRFSRKVATDAVTARRMPDDASLSTVPTGESQRESAGRGPAVGQGSGTEQRPLLVVTNGYHAPRAALLSRKLGVDAQVIGAKTARYFVPSAFLREFVAVLQMNRVLHLVVAGLSFAVTVFMLGVALNWIGI